MVSIIFRNFASSLTDSWRIARGLPVIKHVTMNEEILQRLSLIEEQNKRIERNTLLASKNVLTIEDVAVLIGLTKSWLYKATSRNEIPYYKPNGKTIYFDRKEIESWLLQNRVSTTYEVASKATGYCVTH